MGGRGVVPLCTDHPPIRGHCPPQNWGWIADLAPMPTPCRAKYLAHPPHNYPPTR